jgi:hypothetical protein
MQLSHIARNFHMVPIFKQHDPTLQWMLCWDFIHLDPPTFLAVTWDMCMSFSYHIIATGIHQSTDITRTLRTTCSVSAHLHWYIINHGHYTIQ